MRKQEEVPMATQDSPSLYERLGGVYSIATVVDDLIDRVMADPRLNANPLVDEAHHKVPVPTANPRRLTATANRPILAPNERSLQVDLVRLDRILPVTGCVGG
jgi:hypothetical protein